VSGPVLVHLMRHGEPVLTGRLLGHTDCPATDAGVAACREAASGIATTVAAVASSDLIRATACANAIVEPRGLDVRIDARWRELDFGAWDGHAADTVDRAALGRFWDDPDMFPPLGGERWSTLVARVSAALMDMRANTLVVTHAGAMRAALAAACGFDARQVWAFDLPYAARLTLSLWQDKEPRAQIVELRA